MSTKDFDMHLEYHMRLRPDFKGKIRPEVLSLDWNARPYDWGADFRDIIAVGINNRTRIFARTDIEPYYTVWKMMHNKAYFEDSETKALKWNPSDGTVLASGSNYGGSAVAIEVLKWKDGKVVKEKNFQVPGSGQVTSLSWNVSGTFLLATIDPLDADQKGIMALMRYPTQTGSAKAIESNDSGPFCAVFHAASSFIFSTSVGSNRIHIWSEAEDGSDNWRIVQSINCEKHTKKICCSPDGKLLAAIGGRLKIWDCNFENADLPPNLTVRSRTQNADDGHSRTTGVTLKEHCSHLVSLDISRSGYVLSGSSMGSICLHYDKQLPTKPFKAVCFQWEYVQYYYPSGNITCVAAHPERQWVAHGGTDGLVIIWNCYQGDRRDSERNPNLDRLCYAPEWQRVDDTREMGLDAESIPSISTEQSDSTTEESSVVADNKVATLAEVIAMVKEFQSKKNETEKALQRLQAYVNTELQAVQDSLNDQNGLLDNIVQHLSNM